MRITGFREIATEFIRCEKYIQDALDLGDTHNAEDIFMGILKKEYELWTADNSAIVTQVIHFPRKIVLHLFLAGGNLKELEKLYREIEQWAHFQGISKITLDGRPGWERSFLRGYNFKTKVCNLTKNL